jgi:hypothetical protein
MSATVLRTKHILTGAASEFEGSSTGAETETTTTGLLRVLLSLTMLTLTSSGAMEISILPNPLAYGQGERCLDRINNEVASPTWNGPARSNAR